MVRLRHIAGGVQCVADGLQRGGVLVLIEPVFGQVIDGLEGRRLEVAVVCLPVGVGALAVMRFGGVEVALLQLAVVQVHHGVPVNVAAPAAIHLAVAVVVATVVVAVGVALAGHVDEVPVRGVVDQRSGGAIHRRMLVADPPTTQAGVLEIVNVVGRLAEDFSRTGFAAGGTDVELIGAFHLGRGMGRVEEGQGVFDDILVCGLRPGAGVAGAEGQA